MRVVLLYVLLLMPWAAQANVPSELRPLFRSEAPYGQAIFTFAWMDVYHIALWTDASVWSPRGQYALSITYDMAFTAEELVGRTCEEMARHHVRGKEMCRARQDELKQLMPDVREGDRITAVRTQAGHVRFYKNGAETGSVADPAFTDAFFSIWVGEATSEPALREQLVGQK